jgi:alkylation response protein AidB-like acyl-CoA dehydrogenase
VWLAVRTNPEAKKHRGISMLIVPTSADGFSWTPVHTMAGVDTSATYYQDVRVPDQQPRRRGERRLEAGHQPAQPRARRTGLGAADFHGAQRRP